MTALTHVATKALGAPVTLAQAQMFRWQQYGFTHGNAAISGRVMLFFYFDSLDTGLMALIPGVHGETEVARFRLKGGLAANPKFN